MVSRGESSYEVWNGKFPITKSNSESLNVGMSPPIYSVEPPTTYTQKYKNEAMLPVSAQAHWLSSLSLQLHVLVLPGLS